MPIVHDLFEPISRDERQAQAVKAWIEAKGHATIVAATGFGKTTTSCNIISKSQDCCLLEAPIIT